jgi:sucrose phosphorylase
MGNPVGKGWPKPDMAVFAGKVAHHLSVIYKSNLRESLVNRILSMSNIQVDAKPAWDEKDTLLITYGNSIFKADEKPLQTLHRFLEKRLAGTISCIHILPFFPCTSDDGFSITDYMQVNPAFGDWEDITTLTSDFSLMCDLVINHVSVSHRWFKNYLSNKVPGKDFFIEADPAADYSLVIRPRSTPLFTRFETPDGSREVWTTFSADQADLNFSNPDVLVEMIRVLLFYIRKGIRIIRLDAVAFLWKTKGTSCLHQPETHQIVKLLRDIVSFVSPGTIILTETNVPNLENWSYFGNGDEAHMVYQFSLPPLLLHALFSGSARYLTQWAFEIPAIRKDQTFLNYAASHDGIGIRPLEGILPQGEIEQLIAGMIGFGGQVSNKVNRDGSLSPYEINITYIDAMKGDRRGHDDLQESRFICSQTIMMSLQGIPAFYFNSLVGTPNDYEGVKATGRARSINRKQWREEELVHLLSTDTIHKRLFNELTRLIRIRQGCSAFHPGCPQEIIAPDDRVFAFKRHNPETGEAIYCISNLTGKPVEIRMDIGEIKKGYDLISCESLGISEGILLNSYQTKWIAEISKTELQSN